MKLVVPTPASALAFALRNWLPLVLLIALAQTVRIEGFGIWPLRIHGLADKYHGALAKLNEARAELDRISQKRDNQRAETDRNISKAVNHRIQADKVAERIEAAPLPGNCATPSEIMSAEL